MQIMTLTPGGDQPTKMSSREIAVLTGKQHFHVKRDIEAMFKELQEDASNFGCIYLDSVNREQTEYLLDRELTETLLTGYSAVLRRKVIARWHELEGGASAALNLRDPKQLTQVAAQLLALTNEQASEIKSLEQQIEADLPKVAAFDRVVLCDGDMPISLAAKSLGIDPLKRLFQWMHEHGWIYKRTGTSRWLAHQDKIKAGLLDHRNYPSRQDDGSEKLYPSVVVLPKGLALLAQLVPKELSIPSRNFVRRPYQPGASA